MVLSLAIGKINSLLKAIPAIIFQRVLRTAMLMDMGSSEGPFVFFLKSSTRYLASRAMAVSSEDFPKPRSLRCLIVNLLVFCHTSPLELNKPVYIKKIIVLNQSTGVKQAYSHKKIIVLNQSTGVKQACIHQKIIVLNQSTGVKQACIATSKKKNYCIKSIYWS